MRLIIKKRTVVKLFAALGFKTANTWDDSRLMRKINEIPELVEEVEVKNPKVKRLIEKILKASEVILKEEKSKRPSEDVEEETQEEAQKEKEKTVSKKSEKSKKKAAKETVVKAVVKEKKGYDAFGRRLGTQGALIDEHLDTKGKSVKQLVEECKLPAARISFHMGLFVHEGFLKKDKDNKYILTGKTKAKKTK